MKKKTNIKNVIRQIVREEVAVAIKEVITELRQPSLSSEPTKKPTKVVKKKSYTKNSVLNDVLNETAQSEEWKTLSGEKFDSSRMNELVGGYGDMMNSNSNTAVTVDGQTADFLKKDYRELMTAVDKKQGKI